MQHPVFLKVLKQVNKEARDSWQQQVNVATGTGEEEEFMRFVFMMIRNKVAFHYADLKPLNQSFVARFCSGSDFGKNSLPMLSVGDNVSKTRFYFADAVVHNLMNKTAPVTIKSDFSKKFGALTVKTANALHCIILNFIFIRGGALRSVVEDAKVYPEDEEFN